MLVQDQTYKTGNLKSRVMNLAQTSIYQVKIQPHLLSEATLLVRPAGMLITLMMVRTSNSSVMRQLPGTSFSTHEVTNDYAVPVRKLLIVVSMTKLLT